MKRFPPHTFFRGDTTNSPQCTIVCSLSLIFVLGVLCTISIRHNAVNFVEAEKYSGRVEGQKIGYQFCDADLGCAEFRTSAKTQPAQDAFMRGLLLLHLFEYYSASKEFQRAQQLEPSFAMAYWGEAMSNHQTIWFLQNTKRGQAILQTAHTVTKQLSEKEKLFLLAVEALFLDGGTLKERRVQYLLKMQDIHVAYPRDPEVILFYGLAKLGSIDNRDVGLYMQVYDMVRPVFEAKPKHPGASHYLIHCVDDAQHAVLGKQAADALAKTSVGSPHGLHMPTHVYLALGQWQDTVKLNNDSWVLRARNLEVEQQNLEKEANTHKKEQQKQEHEQEDNDPSYEPPHVGPQFLEWHSFEWLVYGLAQQGRFDEMLEMVHFAENQYRKTPTDTSWYSPYQHWLKAWITYWVHQYQLFKHLPSLNQFPELVGEGNTPLGVAGAVQGMYRVLHVISSLETREEDESWLKNFKENTLPEAWTYPWDSEAVEVMDLMVQAHVELTHEEEGEGDTVLQSATVTNLAKPFMAVYGPPVVIYPPYEFFGELWEKRENIQKAYGFCMQQLILTPHRTTTLLWSIRILNKLVPFLPIEDDPVDAVLTDPAVNRKITTATKVVCSNWEDADAAVWRRYEDLFYECKRLMGPAWRNNPSK